MLAQMPELANIFQWFLSGKHLNRIAHPALWAELEKQEAGYTNLFAALGFELRVDARGFAWFHSKEASSTISKTSRQLALLFMVIFDAQANAGKTLQRFTDWLFDRAWLVEAYKQQQDLLDAEGLTPDKLIETLDQACSRGFASAEAAGWRLLPAVCRYLDHFESLALATKEGSEETVAAATAESKNAPDWLGDEEMD
jgi:hypothetical protein